MARADGGAGVVVAGEATMQAPLASQLEGWLRSHGREVVASPLEPDAINTLVDCFVIEDESCAIGVVEKRAKSQVVVFARIDITAAPDGTRDVTLTGYWFAKGHHALTERRFCERCTEVTLRTTADDLMLALSGAGATEVGHLKLTSIPVGAHVLVDAHVVGVTPLEVDLLPGQHSLSFEADGHQVELRTVTIKRGNTTAIDAKLLVGTGRHDGDKPDDNAGGDDAHASRVLPLAVLGVGAVGVVAGGALIIVGPQKPSAVGLQKPDYTNYRPPGIGIAIGGVAAARGRRVSVDASPRRSGAVVGTDRVGDRDRRHVRLGGELLMSRLRIVIAAVAPLAIAVAALGSCNASNANYCLGRNLDNNCNEPANDAGGPDSTITGCSDDTTCTASGLKVCDTTLSPTACVACHGSDSNNACADMTPTCGSDDRCHACASHSDCASNACLPTGACGSDGDTFYVTPGATGTDCTFESPCGTAQRSADAWRAADEHQGQRRRHRHRWRHRGDQFRFHDHR